MSLSANQVFAHVPLYSNFTLEFDADLDDPQGRWGEVLSHGTHLPTAWLYPEGNRLWVCMTFRFGLCNFTLALARRTCLRSRLFPQGAMQRRVRVSLSPAGSFELHEDYREDGRLELSSLAHIPHRPSSGGVSIPLGTTSSYIHASGRLRELRLTPYIPYPPSPPPPVPATQTLLGDEWHDLRESSRLTLGEVAVGTDWTISFELWPRATVSQRALLFAIGRGGAFWLPKVWLKPGTLTMRACLSSTGVNVPKEVGDLPNKWRGDYIGGRAKITKWSTIWSDAECVTGRRAANSNPHPHSQAHAHAHPLPHPQPRP